MKIIRPQIRDSRLKYNHLIIRQSQKEQNNLPLSARQKRRYYARKSMFSQHNNGAFAFQ